MSSLIFTLPFFYIVGFDGVGNVAQKFFFHWAFEALYMSTLVYLGQFLAAVMPTAAAAGVVGGMMSTLISLFCGFMIRVDDFPTFWLFLYWLNPLHYALEGINMVQFHDDTTIITEFTGATTTAEDYINTFYSSWSYDNRYYDIMALLLFMLALRIGTYLSLNYLIHKKN